MSATVLRINSYFKNANRADINELLSKMLLSERQTRIFEMFYLKRQNIGFIADELCISSAVVCRELYTIRDKILRFIR